MTATEEIEKNGSYRGAIEKWQTQREKKNGRHRGKKRNGRHRGKKEMAATEEKKKWQPQRKKKKWQPQRAAKLKKMAATEGCHKRK
jgi:hypothetical protein